MNSDSDTSEEGYEGQIKPYNVRAVVLIYSKIFGGGYLTT